MFDFGKKQNLAAMLRSIADKLDGDNAMPISIRSDCEVGGDDLLRAKFEIDIAYIGDKKNSDYAEALAALDQSGVTKKGIHTGANVLAMMGKTFYIPKFARCVAIDHNGEVWAYGHEMELIKPKNNVWVVSDHIRSNDARFEKIGDIGKVISSWQDEIYPVNQYHELLNMPGHFRA